MINWHTKFEVSTITCNEDMKGNAKCNVAQLSLTNRTMRCITANGKISQVAQLSVTNPCDALHHNKRTNFKTVT